MEKQGHRIRSGGHYIGRAFKLLLIFYLLEDSANVTKNLKTRILLGIFSETFKTSVFTKIFKSLLKVDNMLNFPADFLYMRKKLFDIFHNFQGAFRQIFGLLYVFVIRSLRSRLGFCEKMNLIYQRNFSQQENLIMDLRHIIVNQVCADFIF